MAQWVKCFLLKHDLNLDFQDLYNQSVVVCIYNPSAGGGAGGGNGDWGRGRGRGWRRQRQMDLQRSLPASLDKFQVQV